MLRTRLILGLLCLLVILLAMGLYSIDRCSQLGMRLEAVSRDNDQAERSVQQMKRGAADMTGALLSLVTNTPSQSRRDFAAASDLFARALAAENAARQSASPEERSVLATLTKSYKAYEARARAFLQSPDQPEADWRLTAARLGQNTSQLLDLLDQLTLAHKQAVEKGSLLSAGDINDTIRSLIFLMIVAVAVAIYASVRLSRGVLDPLVSLTSSIQRVGRGNLDQQVPVQSRDELGMLATSFNEMASQLKQYRNATSEELIRLNATIHATLASFPDPIFVLNAQGVVEFRNPEADQLAVRLLFAGVMRLPPFIEEKVEQVRATGEDYLPTLFKDAIKFHLNGQDQYFLSRIVILRDNQRQAFGVAVILENVTRMLLLDDIKSNLISTVSHELKTPLTSVRMALYLLFEKTVGPLNEKQQDLVSTARDGADRLLRTLNDLLDLARLEQGHSPLKLERVAPSELMESATRDMREAGHSARIALKTEIAADLPDILVDRQRVAYVFVNLISNALKYSSEGRDVLLQATIGQVRSTEPGVRFSVKDQGPGITFEHQQHIFERFYRVPGTTKSGAGLGLSIAREIVVAHQGEIGVISRPGEGSEFFFVLPLIKEPTE